ncbi:hypothetical protein [Treponema sp. C6A8]|uniref:hypothetical protein n=1 Tax=Treponema sp. C6A8 TaxID=1410609 RepID=UPI00047FD078|nr:hypothetical protein [Treponema sp. C6A8]
MTKKIFLLSSIIFSLSFFACNNMLDTPLDTSSQTESVSSDGKTYISAAINDDGSRTALPVLTERNAFTYIILKGKKAGSTEEKILGSWTSDGASSSSPSAYSKMASASIALEAGSWDFYLRASKDGAVSYESNIKNVTLANGTIRLLNFYLGRSDIVLTGSGKIEITLNYANPTEEEDIKSVYAACEQESGNGEYVTSIEKLTKSGGNYTFTKDNVPAGVYCVTFFFYSDNDLRKTDDTSAWWKNCIGYWREYAIVAGGLTSISEQTVESVGSLFHLKLYDSDGSTELTPTGSAGSTFPVTFTRFSSEINLPLAKDAWDTLSNEEKAEYFYVEKPGYDFDGWYTSSDYSGVQAESVSEGTMKDCAFYAKWLKKWTLTYKLTSDKEVPLYDGYSYNLWGIEDLDEDDRQAGKILLGWTKTQNSTKPDKNFEAGASFSPESDLTLYPVWIEMPATTIPVIDASKVTADTDEEKTRKIALYQDEVLRLAKTNAIMDKNYGEYKPYVSTVDSDGDGLYNWEEVYVTITSPWLRDTDGDGWDDKYEITTWNKQSNSFNPLIADLPRLNVTIESAPYFSYNYTTTNGKTLSDSITRSESGTMGHSTNATHSETSGYSRTANVNASWNSKWEVNPAGGKLEHGYNTGFGYSRAWNGSDSYSFSKGESESYSKSVSNGRVNTTNESRSITGGSVKFALKFENPSDIAYTIGSLAVEAFRKQIGVPFGDNASLYVPLGSMKTNSSVSMTLQPHSYSGIINYEVTLNRQQYEELLRNTSGLEVSIAGFSINSKDTQKRTTDFTDAYTSVYQLTSRISIDYGPTYLSKKPEIYNVAVKYKPKKSSSGTVSGAIYEDVTLQDLLNICVGEGNYKIENGILKSIYGLSNASKEKEGSWYVDYRYFDGDVQKMKIAGPKANLTGKTLNDITSVDAKTSFGIFYDVDADGDNVPLKIEKEYGSSDTSKDSDGDGISDYEEIYGWTPSEKTGRSWKKTDSEDHANVLNKMISTRPNLADTDGDGWNDGEDANPIVPRKLDDSSLRSLSYAFGLGQTAKKVDKIPAAKSGSAVFGNLTNAGSSKIWISAIPTLVTSKVTYAIVESLSGKMPENIPADDQFKAIPVYGIELKRNKTFIYIRVLAPDGASKTTYTLPVESPYVDMANFTYNTKPYDTGLTFEAAFNSYEEPRHGSDTAVKYAFYATSSEIADGFLPKGADLTELRNPEKETPVSSELLTSISADDMKKGRFMVKGFKQRTNYNIAIFAYSGTGNDFYIRRICKKDKVEFGYAKKGKFKVYLNWMRLAWDPNAFWSKPEYIWNFKMTGANSELLNNGKLSEVTSDFSRSLNMGRYNWSSFSEDQYRYGRKYKDECSPKSWEIEFDQYEDLDIRLKKQIFYETAEGPDQPLTMKDYVIKYDSKNKKWTIKTDCRQYTRGNNYKPGTDPMTTAADKYMLSAYDVTLTLDKPDGQKELETYYSACSSDSSVRWEYGGMIVNVSFEWTE